MTKSGQREKFLLMRKDLSAGERKERDKKICRKIFESDEYLKSEKLFAYYPVRGEIDLLPLTVRAMSDGKVTALPVIKEDKIIFCEFDGESREGRFGIPEPTGGIVLPDEKTLCIVPGLGYDREKFRIGYGGGFYDRFLRAFTGVSLGAFYSEFYEERLPRDEYDIPLDIIITEKGIF